MKFQFETISQTLAKQSTSTAVPAQIKPRKRRKGLDRVDVLKRCKLALKQGYIVNKDTLDVIGQYGKIITSKSNGRLAINFRVDGVQLTLLQEDYVDFYLNQLVEEEKPVKKRYTAKQVSEYLKLQADKKKVVTEVGTSPTLNKYKILEVLQREENDKDAYAEAKAKVEVRLGYTQKDALNLSQNELKDYIEDLESTIQFYKRKTFGIDTKSLKEIAQNCN